MYDVIVVKRGSTPCGTKCPFYEPSGWVHINGQEKKTHCQLMATPYLVDCETYDVRSLRRGPVDAELLKAQLGIQGVKLNKPRRLFSGRRKPNSTL